MLLPLQPADSVAAIGFMRKLFLLAIFICVSACGTANNTGNVPPDISAHTLASVSNSRARSGGDGPSPFIQYLDLSGASFASLKSLSYTIEPKADARSKPVHVSYSWRALQQKGYVQPDLTIHLPVFGLYAGYSNQVKLQMTYSDDSAEQLSHTMVTSPYADPNRVLSSPSILSQRARGSQLGFDFFVLKTSPGSPVIVDTDGEIRWTTQGIASAESTAFHDNRFIVGSAGMQVYRIELDGSIQTIDAARAGDIGFHHNIEYGRDGLLAEIDTAQDAGSTVVELDPFTGIQKEWNLADILAEFMAGQGDDPGAFVRQGADWFHSNSATYRASDNSLIVSSRENFLVAVDYDSGELLWILGDPAKYWYMFPSLRSKALTLVGGGSYAIGQHSVTITSDDLVMVFDNGLPSRNQPVGAPIGNSRAYSRVVAYRIDTAERTARQIWQFDYRQSIYSAICSSAYNAPDGSMLIDYANANAGAHARLVGLNSRHEVVFDFQYPNRGCGVGWSAIPVPLESVQFH